MESKVIKFILLLDINCIMLICKKYMTPYEYYQKLVCIPDKSESYYICQISNGISKGESIICDIHNKNIEYITRTQQEYYRISHQLEKKNQSILVGFFK